MSLRYIGGLVSPSVNPLAANVTTSPNVAQYNGVFTLQQQGQALQSGQWATDPYYKNTTLLLHADGKANGSQNNTFLDSSSNAFAITRNGNTTQGSFTPYGPTWSNYFGGASDYLTLPDNAAYVVSGDFTVEAWIYPTSFAGTNGNIIASQWPGGTATNQSFQFFVNSTGKVGFVYGVGATNASINGTSQSAVLNTWNHVAVTRSGTTVRFFVNGVLDSTTATVSGSLNDSTGVMTIGRINAADSGYFSGYISNCRLVTGAALYTANFNPLTVPLAAASSGTTVLLTCQSNRFLDNGTIAGAITVGGTPSVQRFSPFAPQYQYTPAVIGGSAYFDGTGDYLQAPDNSAFQFDTSDFTIEGWLYPTTVVAGYQTIWTNRGTTSTSIFLGLDAGTSTLVAYTNNYVATSTTALPLNSWTYFVLSRVSNVIKMFINGVETSSGTLSTNLNGGYGCLIGGGYSGYDFFGYISDFRIRKGSGVTSSTIPTAPLTSATNTSVWCSMQNAGIYDNAMMNNLETVGNAQVSTSVVKYGSGSIYFDGNGDYLPFPASANTNFIFGTGDFTIEFWAWKSANGVNGYDGVIASDANGNATYGFAVELSSSRGFLFYNQSTTRIQASSVNPNDSTWHHYAVVRASGVMALYKDGVQLTTAAYSGELFCVPTLRVGSIATTANFNGYIDDLRVTKGVARYTANFIPPKVAFSNQ